MPRECKSGLKTSICWSWKFLYVIYLLTYQYDLAYCLWAEESSSKIRSCKFPVLCVSVFSVTANGLLLKVRMVPVRMGLQSQLRLQSHLIETAMIKMSIFEMKSK